MRGLDEIFLWSLLIVSTITDLYSGKIYNFITFSAIFLGVAYRFIFVGPQEGSFALFALGIAFIIYFPLYFLRVVAAGDVKLLMAIGAWASPKLTFYLGLSGVLVATFVGLLKIVTELGLRNSMGHFLNNILGKKTKLTRIAFAPSFLCSYLLIQILERRGWL